MMGLASICGVDAVIQTGEPVLVRLWLTSVTSHASAAGDETCSAQLDELRKLLVDVQGIVNYGTFDMTGKNQDMRIDRHLRLRSVRDVVLVIQLGLRSHLWPKLLMLPYETGLFLNLPKHGELCC